MDRLDSAPSGTTRNAVEGRQPNDRRKAGAPVADDRDRPNRTPVASTIAGFHRKLPVCSAILRSGINLDPSPASTIRRAGGHLECKCVDQTLQLDDALGVRLQPGLNDCLAAMYVGR